MIERQRRTELLRKSVAMVALIGSVAVVVVVVAVIGGVWMQILGGDPRSTPAQNSTPTFSPVAAPAANIKPVPVRPVQEVRTPDQCPPERPPPLLVPSDVVSACDLTRSAAYVLGPQAIELQLTGADSVKSPMSESYVVRLTMQPASATAFATLTAGQVGEQLAFVRDGIVVFAPQITGPINSQALEISGNLTAQQADDIARMLRQPA